MTPRLILGSMALLGLLGCSGAPPLGEVLTEADRLAAEGRVSDAISVLNSSIASGQDDPRLRLNLARQYLAVGQSSAALSNLDKAESLGAPPSETDETRVMALLASRRFEAAREIVEARSENLPTARLPLLRGAVALGLGNPAEVLELIAPPTPKRVAEPTAVDAEAVLLRAQALVALGRVMDAISELHAAKELVIHEPRIGVTLAEMLVTTGDVDAALNVIEDGLRRSAEIPPVRRPAWRATLLPLVVDLQLARRQIQHARRSFDELQRFAPHARITRLLEARMKGLDGHADESVRILQTLVAEEPNDIDARLMLAGALSETGRVNQAQAQLDWILARDPKNRAARVLLARAMLRQGRVDSAGAMLESSASDPISEALLGQIKLQLGEDAVGISLLRSSAERDPGNATLRLDLAEALVATGDYQRAQDVLASLGEPGENERRRFERLRFLSAALQARPGKVSARIEALLAESPDDVNLRLLAASLYLQSQGGVASARRHLAEAERIQPRNAAVKLAIGRLESISGNSQAAGAAFHRALEIEPGNTSALAGLAWNALSSGDALEASTWIGELSRIEGPRAKLQALRLHLARGDLAAAKRLEEPLLNGSADSVATMSALAEAYLTTGQARSAEAWARKVVDARADVPEYWLLLSRAQAMLADRSGARQSVQRALNIRPAWLPASRHSIALYLADQNLPGALSVLDALRAAGVDARTLRLIKADVLLAARRYADAAVAYAEFGSIGETREVLSRWVTARRAAGLADPLRPLFEYLGREPLDLPMRILLAQQLAELKQTDLAIREYRRVLESEPDNVVALNNLAWLLGASGSSKQSEALALAQRALAIAPGSPAILDTYGWLLHRAGQSREAVPLLERAVARRPTDPEMRRRLEQVRAAVHRERG